MANCYGHPKGLPLVDQGLVIFASKLLIQAIADCVVKDTSYIDQLSQLEYSAQRFGHCQLIQEGLVTFIFS
jgi:hypothetical protein